MRGNFQQLVLNLKNLNLDEGLTKSQIISQLSNKDELLRRFLFAHYAPKNLEEVLWIKKK